jgi:hypothetical protein
MIDIRVFNCEDNNCGSILSDTTGVVYLPPKSDVNIKPVLIEDIVEVEDLVKKVLEQLPEPQDINVDEYNVYNSIIDHLYIMFYKSYTKK